ncbi:MAG TPA: mannose-1-phosphate guanylyltransferase [Ignavibacteria bacterium]|nr:mannose-1-phosphate guanylyltransferase [Ignavibacteria bacterium]
MNNYAIIMAGGFGTRFWPKGTMKMPKQFLCIESDDESMIQKTFKRLEPIFGTTKIFVVTGLQHKAIVKKQIPQLPEENIILEPFGRNTAPCIALTCLIIKQFDEKANVFVVPSDHIINDTHEFERVIKCGLSFVHSNGGIITLGIHPTKPETGYGYIQFNSEEEFKIDISVNTSGEICENIYKVKTFAEKPTLEVAKAFLESGDFLWNSGMFIFRNDTMLEEIGEYLPDLYSAIMQLEEHIYSNDFPKLLENAYSQIKGISIDYGVMEKSQHVYTIISRFDWSDVGSWDEIYRIREKDSGGNVKHGRTVLINSKNCMVINDQRISAVIGCEDLLIIDTDNGLLICKKGESQNVKEVVDYLRRKGLEQFL